MGNPVFKHVYEEDDILCYLHDKVRAVSTYFISLPLAVNGKFDCIEGLGIVSFYKEKTNELITLVISESLKRYEIGKFIKLASNVLFPESGYYRGDILGRQTIDSIILSIKENLEKALELSEGELSYRKVPESLILSEEDLINLEKIYSRDKKSC